MIYQVEKQLKDLGDKVTAQERANVEAAVNDLKGAMNGGNVETIKNLTEKLSEAFYPIAQRLYSQNEGAQGTQGAEFNGGFGGNQQGGSNNNDDDNIVDADYEVVD